MELLNQALFLDPEHEEAQILKQRAEQRLPLEDFNTEAYSRITDNPFLASTDNPLSTFSIDVDTASYSNVRRFLTSGQLPPKDAVRIEELINYFTYRYSPPEGKEAERAPFAAHVEVGPAPWSPGHRLVRVGLKGREIAKEQRPPANLVFLIDVSGSMQPENKLPLVKKSLKMLLDKLEDKDRVAIAVYAGSQGLVLPSTQIGPDNEKDLPPGRDAILQAIDHLESGGSTNGGAGIELAYKIASEAFIKDGVNRVILATDGDFNVGITNEGDLTRLIEDKAKSGVYLSVLGYGMGNLKDATLEKLADKGNGNYAYIDTLGEAKKVLVEQTGGTLVTIAKDVKIQVEFNPLAVSSYRLIGYENRVLAKEDFNDDTKDAGDIGAGHTVTALYEVVPATNEESPATPVAGSEGVDPLKYQTRIEPTDAAKTGELLTLKLRYKAPDAQAVQGTSKLIEFPVKDTGRKLGDTSEDFRFASSVAAFGMLLRESPHKGEASFAQVLDLAGGAMGADEHGYRAEFVELVRRAEALAKPAAAAPPATQPQP